ncbi:type III toxin-antitoxin system CptIN family toxin [Paradesulfitobacterium ferrireducens]|uniref:type III toxin-antitoxin system CptIN family toxin n=1 Tax=Paradesulfitobacterium ferrireducens TaxID=2816476 RepID=UPI001F47DF5B|nr:hypothetical protein [Paradesulfitobacterium ferrireducens]
MTNNQVTIGNFYFIEDQYFEDFPDPNLMTNKKTVKGVEHNRPCFYSLLDNKTGIMWFIPISSQVDKFEQIYNKKLEKYKEVDTIVFGYVMGNKRVFLIQSMFPITSKYIMNVYIDTATMQPVVINEKLRDELNKKANKVLSLQRKGFRLIFPNVLAIERILIENMESIDQAASSIS